MAAFGLALPAGAQSLPPPELLFVWPDRPAPGDEVELTGQHFSGPGCTVKVVFSPGQEADPKSVSGETLRVDVPPGATNGKVHVVRTCREGSAQITTVSNPLPILVIWRDLEYEYSTRLRFPLETGTCGYLVGFSGRKDEVYCAGGAYLIYPRLGVTWVNAVSVSGGQATVKTLDYRYSGEYYPEIQGVSVSPDGTVVWLLRDVVDGKYRFTITSRDGRWSYSGRAGWSELMLGQFSPSGELLVVAQDWSDAYGFLVAIWSFPPNAAISFDLSSPYCLTPNPVILGPQPVVPLLSSTFQDYAGSTYFLWTQWLGDCPYAPCWNEMRLTRIRDGQAETFPLPYGDPSAPCQPDFWSWWHAGADCQGRVYGTEVGCAGAGNMRQWTGILRLFPDFSILAQAPPGPSDGRVENFAGFTTDRWGNLYLGRDWLLRWEPGGYSVWHVRFHRVMPDELVGTYCPLWETGQQSGGLTAHEQSTDSCSRCREDKKKLVVKWVKNPERPNPDDPVNVAWIDSPVELLVNLGESPGFAAYLCKQNERQCDNQVEARWEIQELSVAPGVDMEKAIYPDHPLFLYGDNLTERVAHSGRLQTVHLGHAKLKVTVADSQGIEVEPLILGISVGKPTALGVKHNDFDGIIAEVAHQFGIPPQYLKGQVHQESSFNPNAYRYEMRHWDADGTALWDEAKWKDESTEYYLYRFPRQSPSILSDEDVAPRNQFEIITEFNDKLVPPNWPYATRHLTIQDDPVLLWDLYEANEGWPCGTYSWYQYNQQFPCDSVFERKGPTYYNSNQRQLWYGVKELEFMNFHRPSGTEGKEDKFWCGLTKKPEQCEGKPARDAAWLLHLKKKKWAAQTAIAASYGLLQLGYTTAAEECMWNQNQPGGSRHPSSLFDPKLNLLLGGRYDARCMRKALEGHSITVRDKEGFEAKLAEGFGYFNAGINNRSNLVYGQKVVETAKLYLPR